MQLIILLPCRSEITDQNHLLLVLLSKCINCAVKVQKVTYLPHRTTSVYNLRHKRHTDEILKVV